MAENNNYVTRRVQQQKKARNGKGQCEGKPQEEHMMLDAHNTSGTNGKFQSFQQKEEEEAPHM